MYTTPPHSLIDTVYALIYRSELIYWSPFSNFQHVIFDECTLYVQPLPHIHRVVLYRKFKTSATAILLPATFICVHPLRG